MVRVTRKLRLVLLLASGCAAESTPAPGRTRACPDGQMDLDVTHADGRRVRECVEFRGALWTASCSRIGYGGNSLATTFGDPTAPGAEARFNMSNAMNLGEARGTVTVPFAVIIRLDRAGECPPGQRSCAFVALSFNPTQVCLVEAVLPVPGERVISYRLTAPCRVGSYDFNASSPRHLNDGREMILHRADFRGPLLWLGDTPPLNFHDAGVPYVPDCGTAF